MRGIYNGSSFSALPEVMAPQRSYVSKCSKYCGSILRYEKMARCYETQSIWGRGEGLNFAAPAELEISDV